MAALAAASGMSAAGMRAAGTYASAGAAYSSAGSTCSSVCACLPRADTLAAGVNASLGAPASFSGMPVCF